MFQKRIAVLLLLGFASAFCPGLFSPNAICYGQEVTLADRFSSMDDFHRALYQIRKGYSQEQVEELLGPPGGLYRHKNQTVKEPTRWYYCTHCFDGTHRVSYIFFDKDSKVTRFRKGTNALRYRIPVLSFSPRDEKGKTPLIAEFSNDQAEELVKKLKSYAVSLDEDVLKEQLQQVITQNLNGSQKDKAEQLTQQVWPRTKADLEKHVSLFNSISDTEWATKLLAKYGPIDKGDGTRKLWHEFGVSGYFESCSGEPFGQGNWINVELFGLHPLNGSFKTAIHSGGDAGMMHLGGGINKSLDATKKVLRIDLKPFGLDKQFNWELPIFAQIAVKSEVSEVVYEDPNGTRVVSSVEELERNRLRVKIEITATTPDVEVTLKPKFKVTVARRIKIPKGFNTKTGVGEKDNVLGSYRIYSDSVSGTYKIRDVKLRMKAEQKDERKFENK